jgi:hypothetical protein
VTSRVTVLRCSNRRTRSEGLGLGDVCWDMAIIALASSRPIRRCPAHDELLVHREVEVRDDHWLQLDGPAHDARGAGDELRRGVRAWCSALRLASRLVEWPCELAFNLLRCHRLCSALSSVLP